MYRATDVTAIAEEAAAPVVSADRAKYVPFLRAVEEYAYANNLVIAGGTATRLLLGEPPGPDDYVYEVLAAERPLSHGQRIAEQLYAVAPEGLGRHVYMRTDVPREVFSIYVNERRIVVLRTLPKSRDSAQISKVVIPSVRPASFASVRGQTLELQCLGPELRLIDTYAALSNPAQADRWPGLLADETRLRTLFLGEIGAKVAAAVGVAGGAEEPSAEVGDLVWALLRDFVNRTGIVLVGPYATGLRGGSPAISEFRGVQRLQVVTANAFADDEEAIRRIAEKLRLKIEASVNDVRVPTDPELRRMTLYVTRGGGQRREPFIDLFDSASRELVPFGLRLAEGGRRARSTNRRTRGARPTGQTGGPYPVYGSRLGSFFVLLRYRLVDIWTILLLLRGGAIWVEYANQRLRALVADFRGVAAEFDRAAADPARFGEVFPEGIDSYAGQYVSPAVAVKRAQQAARAAGERHHDYYPGRAKKTDGRAGPRASSRPGPSSVWGPSPSPSGANSARSGDPSRGADRTPRVAEGSAQPMGRRRGCRGGAKKGGKRPSANVE